eukprot:Selendium_serpulae@DN9276_c0_g1_i1.p1
MQQTSWYSDSTNPDELVFQFFCISANVSSTRQWNWLRQSATPERVDWSAGVVPFSNRHNIFSKVSEVFQNQTKRFALDGNQKRRIGKCRYRSQSLVHTFHIFSSKNMTPPKTKK